MRKPSLKRKPPICRPGPVSGWDLDPAEPDLSPVHVQPYLNQLVEVNLPPLYILHSRIISLLLLAMLSLPSEPVTSATDAREAALSVNKVRRSRCWYSIG